MFKLFTKKITCKMCSVKVGDYFKPYSILNNEELGKACKLLDKWDKFVGYYNLSELVVKVTSISSVDLENNTITFTVTVYY